MLKDIDRLFEKYQELAKPYELEISQNPVDGRTKVFMKYKFNGKQYGGYVLVRENETEDGIKEAIGVVKDVFRDQIEKLNHDLNERSKTP